MDAGLYDRRKGRSSPRPLATAEQVLALYREKYFDLKERHVHEKLRESMACSSATVGCNERCDPMSKSGTAGANRANLLEGSKGDLANLTVVY